MTVRQFLTDAIHHISKYGQQTSPNVTEFDEVADWDATCILIKARSEASLESQRIRKNAARRARHAAYVDLGMKRVHGSLGGVYYE